MKHFLIPAILTLVLAFQICVVALVVYGLMFLLTTVFS